MSNLLDSIPESVRQNIYECISQALGEDYQSADSYLELSTHISKPFLTWDLIYRNLINAFGDENVKYSTTVRGMWTVLLLYDVKSRLLISFMRDTRLDTIKKLSKDRQPQYISALIGLNEELQAPNKQQNLFVDDSDSESNNTEMNKVLDELCSSFDCHIEYSDVRHALITFSGKQGYLSSLQAYVLDKDLDVVDQQNWLDMVNPVMSNEIVCTESKTDKLQMSLKPKAKERLKGKDLVELKDIEKEKQA